MIITHLPYHFDRPECVQRVVVCQRPTCSARTSGARRQCLRHGRHLLPGQVCAAESAQPAQWPRHVSRSPPGERRAVHRLLLLLLIGSSRRQECHGQVRRWPQQQHHQLGPPWWWPELYAQRARFPAQHRSSFPPILWPLRAWIVSRWLVRIVVAILSSHTHTHTHLPNI